MRKIKGIFLENLELNDFPVDVQVKQTSYFNVLLFYSFLTMFQCFFKDLTITISTTLASNEVLFIPDVDQLSTINTRTRTISFDLKSEMNYFFR